MGNEVGLVIRESQAIISADTLLRMDPAKMDTDTAVTAWSVLDLFEKELLSSRKLQLREVLLERAKDSGDENKNGSRILKTSDGGKITRVRSSGKVTFDKEKLEALLKKKIEDGKLNKTAISKVLVKKTDTVVDEKALEGLIVAGVITQKDLKSVSDVADDTYSLRVTKPKKVLALLPG